MIAFHDIKTEMREAIAYVTHPAWQGAGPTRLGGAHDHGDADDAAMGPIAPWMEASFHALTHASETGEPFALVACTMNGEPAVIIAATKQERGSTFVLPLFLAVQPGMHFLPLPAEEDEAA